MRIVILLLSLFCTILFGSDTLAQLISKTPAGSKIQLPKGVFKGPIIIDKPLILVGIGKDSIIENDEKGTVITIKSSNVTIKNIQIQKSGHQRYSFDSGIKVKNSSSIRIENCTIKDTLFGIYLYNTNHSKILNNFITSYDEKVVDNRGDGIRLWQSNDNDIVRNRISNSRDLSIYRSNHTLIKNNTIQNSRHAIMINMCKNTYIISNKIFSNYTGIMSMNNKNLSIENNTITKTHLSTGTGIMLKNGKKIYITHNSITNNAQAIYIDSSTSEIGMQRYITDNKIAYNNSAFHFHNTIQNNTIKNNNIIGNLEDVVKDIREQTRYKNQIELNYWDRYIGFDKNRDGISDIPYQVLIYSDKLWQFDHHLKFFYGTPLLSIIDFLEKIAPFTEPTILLVDPKPKTKPIKTAGTTQQNPL